MTLPKARASVSTDYVNNADMHKCLLEFHTEYHSAKAEGRPLPKVPEYIGACVLKIAEGLALRGNFIGYPFRDEMIYDGVFDCIKYCHSFNPHKYDKPFAYFNRIIWQAFVRRIEREKKDQYVKMKIQEQVDIFGENSSSKNGDSSSEREFKEFHKKLEEKFGKKK